jgi:hypothetical protein
MLEEIPDSQEIILNRTGHMFRYSHPLTYAKTILMFLRERFGDDLSDACA